MLGFAVRHERSVVSLDKGAFDQACAELLRTAASDGMPDLLIGIPTGGRFVGQSMAAATGGALPMLPLTCRRPSTRLKPTGSTIARRMIAGFPRPVVDRLRLVEHALLNHRPPKQPATPFEFDGDELADIATWIASAGKRLSILIVDDAVDSGATLSQVMNMIRLTAPETAEIRTAAITVTTSEPLVQPDYAMFHGALCRFPWSLDAR